MRYFFYNIYGDADELINTIPSDVVSVPFGWDEATEQARNQIIKDHNLCSVSTLPSVIFWYPKENTFIDPSDNAIHKTPPHWKELRVLDMDKPWSWDKIDTAIDEWITR